MSQLATTEFKPPVAIQKGVFTPTDFEGLYRLASILQASGFAPKGLERPEQVFAALAHGMEIGLTPMQSMQSIAVINGKPSIYGDAGLALVRASGLLEDFTETMQGDGDNRAAVCISKRQGMPTPRETRFSVADAKRARLWGKEGPWTFYPERMLMFRARTFNLRDQFGDILKGLSFAEEAADEIVTNLKQVQNVAPLSDRLAAHPLALPAATNGSPVPDHAPASVSETPKPPRPKAARGKPPETPAPAKAAAPEPVDTTDYSEPEEAAQPAPFDPTEWPEGIERATHEWMHYAGCDEETARRSVAMWMNRARSVKSIEECGPDDFAALSKRHLDPAKLPYEMYAKTRGPQPANR